MLQDPAGDDGSSDKEECVGRGVMRLDGFGSNLGAGSNQMSNGSVGRGAPSDRCYRDDTGTVEPHSSYRRRPSARLNSLLGLVSSASATRMIVSSVGFLVPFSRPLM